MGGNFNGLEPISSLLRFASAFFCRIAGRLAIIFYVAAVCAVTAAPDCSLAASAPEYDVKAALAYNFAKFVEWPDGTFSGPRSPISLCIYGRAAVEKAFMEINGKKVQGREIVIKGNEDIEDVKGCKIIFVSSSDKRLAAQVLESVKGLSILTIGEMPEFIHYGGIINFTLSESKVRFEINPQAAKRCGISISSQLLKLADIPRGH